jgi:hypothetical protein
MRSFRTDFEMHASRQEYYKEHLTSISTDTHIFGNGDPDADHLKVTVSAGGIEFAQSEKSLGNRDLSQAQERQLDDTTVSNELDKPQWEAKAVAPKACKFFTQWDRIRSKKHFNGDPMGAVKRQATINLG